MDVKLHLNYKNILVSTQKTAHRIIWKKNMLNFLLNNSFTFTP